MKLPDAIVLGRVRSAYERGRAVHALRTAACAAPMVLLSFGGCGRPATSIAIGAALAVVVVGVVWRGGAAGRAAAPGLVAGLASLVAPLVACRAFERAGIVGALPLAMCVAGGLGSGAIVVHYAARERGSRAMFVLAGAGIAALVGALGCAFAGFGGVVAMLVGLVVVAPAALRNVPTGS